MKAELTKLCKRLRLSQNLVENALDIEAPTHPEYLAEVLRRELTHRETMRRNRLLKQAGFPSLKLFRDFVFDEVKLPVPLTVEELKNTRFLDDRRNLIFYGNVGTGKTHLATALGIAACQAGKQVRFFRTASLVNQLVQARKTGQLDKLLKQFGKQDLLICDEWGYVRVCKIVCASVLSHRESSKMGKRGRGSKWQIKIVSDSSVRNSFGA